MKAPVLYVLGTPDGLWADWALSWLQSTPFGREFELPAGATERLQQQTGGGAERVDPAFDDVELASWLPPADADAPWGGVARDGCWAIDALAGQAPDAFFLALIEGPDAGLAALLDRGGAPADAASLQGRWRAGSRRLLWLVQCLRSRCLLLDADEARRHPQAAWAELSVRLGLEG